MSRHLSLSRLASGAALAASSWGIGYLWAAPTRQEHANARLGLGLLLADYQRNLASTERRLDAVLAVLRSERRVTAQFDQIQVRDYRLAMAGGPDCGDDQCPVCG